MHYPEAFLKDMELHHPNQYRLLMEEINDAEQKTEDVVSIPEDQSATSDSTSNSESVETVAETKVEETKTDSVVPADDVVKTENTTPEPVKDYEYYVQKAQKEADSWKKRAADAQSALTPKLQENAELKKENNKLEEEISLLREEFKNFASKMQSQVQPESHQNDSDDDPFPELTALKSENAALRAEMKLLREEFSNKLTPIEKTSQEAKARLEQELKLAQEAKHFAEVSSIHPDAGDYFNSQKKGDAFYAWALELPEYKKKVVLDPALYHPTDVADIISEFKSAVETKKPSVKPSLGDMASRIKVSPPAVEEKKQVELLSELQLANFSKLLHQAVRQGPEAVKSLNERYEHTMASFAKGAK